MSARALSALFALFAFALVAGCKGESPEEQIRKRVEAAVKALEEGKSGEAAEILHEDYGDKSGRDKRTLKLMAFSILRGGPVHVLLRDVEIQVAPDKASATYQATVYALQGAPKLESVQDLLPKRGRKLQVSARFVLDDGEWYVKSIEGVP